MEAMWTCVSEMDNVDSWYEAMSTENVTWTTKIYSQKQRRAPWMVVIVYGRDRIVRVHAREKLRCTLWMAAIFYNKN